MVTTRKSKTGRWSMKHDRELMELSKSRLTLDAIAERCGVEPSWILKRAARLGLAFKRRPATRVKAKGPIRR